MQQTCTKGVQDKEWVDGKGELLRIVQDSNKRPLANVGVKISQGIE